jgi:hypothetical protein
MSVHFENGGERDPLVRLRRVGDRYTWMMDLDTTGIETPDIPNSVIESSTFRLRVKEEDRPVRN